MLGVDNPTQPAAADDAAVPIVEVAATAAPAVDATPAKPKVPGVAATARTRAYFAGVVIARHGHAAGVTDEMVAAVNSECGHSNRTESETCLRNAWHCLRGVGLAAALPGAWGRQRRAC